MPAVAIAAVVRDLFHDERVRRVVIHYLATGKPLAIEGMICNHEYSPNELDPVGAWSQWAEPSIGWQPTLESMRRLVLAIAEGGA